MLHDEVRAAREALGMSQRKLAELPEIPRSQLSAFEAHGTNITLETLRKIVQALPNIQHLSLGVRDVQVSAGRSDVPMRQACPTSAAPPTRCLRSPARRRSRARRRTS